MSIERRHAAKRVVGQLRHRPRSKITPLWQQASNSRLNRLRSVSLPGDPYALAAGLRDAGKVLHRRDSESTAAARLTGTQLG